MSYCARCKRYLNGALSCAGCGSAASVVDDHPTMPLPPIRIDDLTPRQSARRHARPAQDATAPARPPQPPAPPASVVPPAAVPLRAQNPLRTQGSLSRTTPLPVPLPTPVPMRTVLPTQRSGPAPGTESKAGLGPGPAPASGRAIVPAAGPAKAPVPASASDPASAPDPVPVHVPVPVPMNIPSIVPASATGLAAGAGSGSDGFDDAVDSDGAPEDGRVPRGWRHVSTGVLVGGVAVVAIVIGGVVFTSSPGSRQTGQSSRPDGLLPGAISITTSPVFAGDGRGLSGQSAAPTHSATPTATPSAGLGPTPTATPSGAGPSPTPTATSGPKVVPTTAPAATGPFTVTAAKFSNSNNVQTEQTTDPGVSQDVGWITNGSWVAYNGVTFPSGMAGTVRVRLASVVQGNNVGQMQFRLNSPTAPPFATLSVNGTGGWQQWVTSGAVAESPVPAGTYTLYVTFTNGGGDFVNVNWFQFS